MGPPSSEVTEFEEEIFLLHVYPPCAILKFSFWLKTPNLAILAMFEVPKPMTEFFSRFHIMFFQGIRPMAFGPKFISNYSRTKNRDRHNNAQDTTERRDWKCAGGAEPPECEYFACRCPFFQWTFLRRIVLQGAGGSPKFFFFMAFIAF